MSEATHRPTGPAHPTRQQLDELEALMQRMLELPVNHLDEDAGSPPVGTVLPASPPWPDLPPPEEAVREPRFNLPEPKPEPSAEQPVHHDAPPAAPTAILAAAPTVRRPPRHATDDSALLAPLLWLNRTFDRTVGRLGKPGRWLRSAAGRTLLGWIGLLCLAAALALGVFDALGWAW